MMAFRYPVAVVARMCRGILTPKSPQDLWLTHVVTDSRVHFSPAGSIFFSLRGERHDGHLYVAELIRKGVQCVVCETIPDGVEDAGGTAFILVPNTLEALQQFAGAHRQEFSIPVAAITGSNGKTIVKEWLAQLLAPEFRITRSPLSYNSQVGVPLSVLQLSDQDQMAIFEAGISMPGEMGKLETVIRPTIGLFTGIGDAHNEHFTDTAQKINEKLILFSGCTHLICFDDDLRVMPLISAFAHRNQVILFRVGTSSGSNLILDTLNPDPVTPIVQGIYLGQHFSLQLPYADHASVRNSLLCLATLLFLNYPPETAVARIGMLEPVAMRLEQIAGIQHCILINDSYNNDLLALKIALEHLKHNNARPGKCIILSDIFQSGLDNAAMVRQLAELINGYIPQKFIGIGEIMGQLAGMLHCETWFYNTTDQFLRYHPMSGFRDEVILLKGARSFQFERIRDALQHQSHDTTLKINLGALTHNYNYFKSMIPKQTRIMAMVKASSYGSGSFEIAGTLQFHQVDYLAVAYADEGVELRKAGIKTPVMVMSPERGAFGLMIEHQLEPELYSFPILHDFIQYLEKNYPALAHPVPVHIEVDTGMHRLGFDPTEIEHLLHLLQRTKAIEVRSVFSHLATADDLMDHSFARSQIACFEQVKEQFIAQRLTQRPLFHLLNSAGIIQYPEAHYDMVRPGIGLYGIASDPEVQKALRQIGSLQTVITQIRWVKQGESVGYNRSFIADRELLIGTIAIGYADGFPRKLGNGVGKVRIRQTLVPVIGDVCMDMTMVDLSEIADVQVGEEVIVFDEDTPITDLARTLQTIPYEILTSVSSRVKRIYLSE
jgi:Alr-MurF fusion protein